MCQERKSLATMNVLDLSGSCSISPTVEEVSFELKTQGNVVFTSLKLLKTFSLYKIFMAKYTVSKASLRIIHEELNAQKLG